MPHVSVTVKNNKTPIIQYFSLDWDGGHLETNRFYENQSETLSADIPDGATVTVRIYKLIVSWDGIWEGAYPVDRVPSCLEISDLGQRVSVC